MTRVLLFIDRPAPGHAWYTTALSERDVLFLVNTRKLIYGVEYPDLKAVEREQNAFIVRPYDVVTVSFRAPLVDLRADMYPLLFLLADGKTGPELARALGKSEDDARRLEAQMLACFGVSTREEMIGHAFGSGLI